MNLRGSYILMKSPDFRDRVAAAMRIVARDIRASGLPQGDPQDIAALEIIQHGPDRSPHMDAFLWSAATYDALSDPVGASGSAPNEVTSDTDIIDIVRASWSEIISGDKP